MACSGGGSEPQLFYTYGCFAPQLFGTGFIGGESHIFKAQEHFPQALCGLGSRHGVFTGAYRGIVILKLEQQVLVNCFLTDGIIWWQPLANGIHNRSCCRDSVMCVMDFSVACIRGGLLNGCHTLPPSIIPPLFLPSGQLQEVSLSEGGAAPQVEVTPELDLEVVPESSGDWHNVFWAQTTRDPTSEGCAEFYSWAEKLFQASSSCYSSQKIEECVDLLHFVSLTWGAFPDSLFKISSQDKGVWFPATGLMSFVNLVTVWLPSWWWPPERSGSADTGFLDSSSCWSRWKEGKV